MMPSTRAARIPTAAGNFLFIAPSLGGAAVRLSYYALALVREASVQECDHDAHELLLAVLEEMLRPLHHDLVRSRDGQGLALALVGAPHGDRPVVAAVDVEGRDLDAVHLLQALQDADEHPGAHARVLGAAQVLVCHGGAEAARPATRGL